MALARVLALTVNGLEYTGVGLVEASAAPAGIGTRFSFKLELPSTSPV